MDNKYFCIYDVSKNKYISDINISRFGLKFSFVDSKENAFICSNVNFYFYLINLIFISCGMYDDVLVLKEV